MRFRIAALLGVISLAVLVSSAGAFASQKLMEDVNAFDKLERDVLQPDQKISQLEKQYASVIADVDRDGIRNLSDEELRGFFRASETVSFYTNEPSFTKDMHRA